MRLNLTVLAVMGATMLAGTGCGEGDVATDESPRAPITVTEMSQLPDGTWKTTSTRTIPAPPAIQPELSDGVEVRQNPLYFTPCSGTWHVALWSQPGFAGDVLCLSPNGSTGIVPIGWIFPARSVMTVTPVKVFDSNNNIVYFSCSNSIKWNGALSPAGNSVQENSPRSAICSF